MKKLCSLLNSVCLVFLTTGTGKSQILNENFNSGMPLNWNQSPASSWNHSTDLGTGGSGCFFRYQVGSASGTSNISTPPLNLSAVTNITLNFQVASVANNFVGPDLALYYDAGAGPQFVARWGSGFNPVTTYTITYSSDYVPPLDSINVNWIACTHTISSINASAVRFIFEGEIVNGGYALLDDIVIMGSVTTITTALAPALQEPSFVLFPNPTLNKKV